MKTDELKAIDAIAAILATVAPRRSRRELELAASSVVEGLVQPSAGRDDEEFDEESGGVLLWLKRDGEDSPPSLASTWDGMAFDSGFWK